MKFDPKASPAARQKAVKALIAELSADARPIILGPYRSEVGFECLYWMPFLRKLASQVPDFDKRAAIVTRGGLAPLYATVASQGYDLYALRDVAEIRRENLYDHQQQQMLKQMRPTAWDDAAIEDAATALRVGPLYHTIHPAWMYWTLEPYWNEDAGLRYLLSLCDFSALKKPALPTDIAADLKYVAVKFYGRHTFPYPNADVADFVTRTVSQLASQTNVVVLSSESEYDDHADIQVSGPNIHRLPANLPPEQNLMVLASVLAHATAFVGTYGGVAQMALRMRVPSVSFWHGDFAGTAHGHLSLSSWLALQTGTPFLAGSIHDAALWAQVVGGVTVQRREAVAA